MSWKPEYETNRRVKKLADPEYAAKCVPSKRRTPEENRIYMREYYAANKDKWKRSPEEKERRNDMRRERYASDAALAKLYRKPAGPKGKSKARDTYLRKEFGIGIDEYDRLLADQGGMCAICDASENYKGRRFAIDHCHDTGAVRGLLCDNCNRGLGLFKDNTDRLDKAIEYLWIARSKALGDLVPPE